MKYSEFREYSTFYNIPLKEDEDWLIADNRFEISKTEERRIVFLIDNIQYPYEYKMLKEAIELAETPLSEREEEKKYYIRHRFINDLTAEKYININIFGEVTIRDHLGSLYYKTKFTKAEIEELKEKYNTDLRDFELIEVED